MHKAVLGCTIQDILPPSINNDNDEDAVIVDGLALNKETTINNAGHRYFT
jgi:hypothetical protein